MAEQGTYSWGGRLWASGTGPEVGDFNAAPLDMNLYDNDTLTLQYIGGAIGGHGQMQSGDQSVRANVAKILEYYKQTIAAGFKPGDDSAAIQAAQQTSALLQQNFPWLPQIGVSLEQIQGMVANSGDNPQLLLAQFQQTEGYKIRFDGIRNERGEVIMSEKEFLDRERDYATVLKQHGRFSETNRFEDFKTYFKMGIAPDELDQRLTLYDNIDRGGREVKDALYVYAGMSVTTDDLYEAMVNPEAQKAMLDQYTTNVTNNPVDYQTFIQRATERARLEAERAYWWEREQEYSHRWGGGSAMYQAAKSERERLDSALANGPGAGIPGLQATGQQMAAVTDQLYRGDGGKLLSLSELTHAAELAFLGAAATGVGLTLPGKDRVEQLRQAGISRASAQQSYGQFAAAKDLLAGMGERAGFRIDQDVYERGALLNEGTSRAGITQAQAQEASLGTEGGVAAFEADPRTGRVRQKALRAA